MNHKVKLLTIFSLLALQSCGERRVLKFCEIGESHNSIEDISIDYQQKRIFFGDTAYGLNQCTNNNHCFDGDIKFFNPFLYNKESVNFEYELLDGNSLNEINLYIKGKQDQKPTREVEFYFTFDNMVGLKRITLIYDNRQRQQFPAEKRQLIQYERC